MLEEIRKIAEKEGTPVLVIDHDLIRENYNEFKTHLPNVQAYYAVKANPDPAIIKTLYKMGASFDVASLQEFMLVYENIKHLPHDKKEFFVYDKIIYANPVKPVETLEQLDKYKPLLVYDNSEELKKVKKFCPHAGLLLRIRVPNTGAMVELSSKFGANPGDAADLIEESFRMGIKVEGISFHVGSQCTNFENYMQALNLAAGIFKEVKSRGYDMKILDIGGGFPAKYHRKVKSFKTAAKRINSEIERLFPKEIEILAEPGRFLVATAATLVTKIIGKSERDDKIYYYIDDGVYHTYSGVIFDHCKYHIKSFKEGETKISAVAGPTCDALDIISLAEELPELEIGDLLYTENIGAYSIASTTYFNGLPPAKVVHINFKNENSK